MEPAWWGGSVQWPHVGLSMEVSAGEKNRHCPHTGSAMIIQLVSNRIHRPGRRLGTPFPPLRRRPALLLQLLLASPGLRM